MRVFAGRGLPPAGSGPGRGSWPNRPNHRRLADDPLADLGGQRTRGGLDLLEALLEPLRPPGELRAGPGQHQDRRVLDRALLLGKADLEGVAGDRDHVLVLDLLVVNDAPVDHGAGARLEVLEHHVPRLDGEPGVDPGDVHRAGGKPNLALVGPAEQVDPRAEAHFLGRPAELRITRLKTVSGWASLTVPRLEEISFWVCLRRPRLHSRVVASCARRSLDVGLPSPGCRAGTRPRGPAPGARQTPWCSARARGARWR